MKPPECITLKARGVDSLFSIAKVERFPIDAVLSNQVFLAYAVNGKTLPQKHGFPLRVVAEGYYGSDWVKYVYQMKVERL